MDSNILLAIIEDPEKEGSQYTMAKQILDDVKCGKIQAVISSLTLSEIFFVLKSQLSKNTSKLAGMDKKEKIEYVNRESKIEHDKLKGIFLELPNVKFDDGSTVYTKELFIDILNITEKIKGKIKIYNRCPNCDADYRSNSFKSAGIEDILHVLIAKNTGCDELITFDQDFEELRMFEEFKPLSIIVHKKGSNLK